MSTHEDAPGGVPNSASAKPPPRPEAPKLDPVYYTWSSTFSILMGRYVTGSRDVPLERKYFEEMDAVKAESYCKRCETNRDYLLQYSPIVKFMKDEVGKLGGDLNSKNIHCRMCTAEQSGGFHVDHGIMLCANKFRNRGHQEDTMAHEMVHAWDHLKFKVEDNNLRHQACLEVRTMWAHVLSTQEIQRQLPPPSLHSQSQRYHPLTPTRSAPPPSPANAASPASSSPRTNGA
jgi:inner membrane protease ATP23